MDKITVGGIVRRVQGDRKFGILPASALTKEWVVLGFEERGGGRWVRVNSPETLAKVGTDARDEWGKPYTRNTDSTIFMLSEVRPV